MTDNLKAALALGVGLCCGGLAQAEDAAGAQPATAAETPAAAEAPPAEDAVTRDLFDAVKWLQLERDRNKYISDAVKAADADGVRRQYQGVEPVEITRRSIVMEGLENNLRVKRGQLGVNVADAALEEARAVFEPVFNVGLTHRDSSTFNRVENLTKFKKGTEVINGQNRLVFEEGVVEYLAYDLPRPAGMYPTTEFASDANVFGSDNRRVFNLSMQQALPWGADLAVSYQMQFHNRYYINNGGARTPGLTTYGNYYRPWSGSLSASINTPLPFTRNFGRNSVREINVKLAGINREVAEEGARARINITLRDVDVAYYDLVQSVLVLDITLSNKRQVEEAAAKTEKLLKMELVTQLHKSQVDAELARVSGEVEQAWANYVTASNALNRLTNQDPRRLLLPVGYAEKLNGKVAFSEEDESLKDASGNPVYRSGAKVLDAAQLTVLQKQTDVRPDVKVDFTSSYVQLDSTFGYTSLDTALGSTFDPDQRTYNMGIAYNRPWGNRAAKAGLRIAELEVSAQTASLKQTLNQQNRGLDDALVNLASARVRSDIAQRNLDLQRATYDKALAAQGGRTVTEFELITQSRNLLGAHLAWVGALVGAKQAEIDVLAAAGVLPDRFGELTALSMLDETRLVTLNEQHKMRYFGGEVR